MRVVVDDEGPGFPAGDPAQLFDKFQRGSEEGAVVGAGLGLTICRAIVRAHGGEIEAGRRDGQGVNKRGGSNSRCRRRSRRVTEAMHQILVIEDEPRYATCSRCSSRRRVIG